MHTANLTPPHLKPHRPALRVPFYVAAPSGRPARLTLVDRVTQDVYTVLPAERAMPEHDPRSRVRVYRNGRRVEIPANVPNTAADAYRYAVETAHLMLAVGHILNGNVEGEEGNSHA